MPQAPHFGRRLVAKEAGHRVCRMLKQCRIVPDHPGAYRQSQQQGDPEQFADDGKDEPQQYDGDQAGDDERVIL